MLARSQDTYIHGHQEAVLRAHRWRTAGNSAGYLIEHLQPGMSVLDVGCGPGTITADLAKLVAPGHVIGIDNGEEPLVAARELTGPNFQFRHGDVYDLDFADGIFDVVHAHQVLQHLSDPVAALREMRRVCRPAGIVAARDSDYEAMTWFPSDPALDLWLDVYRKVARANRAEPDAGRHLASWASLAGFSDVTCSASAWCFATRQERAWWGGRWADRITSSALSEQILAQGHLVRSDLEQIANAWRCWAANDIGWFAVLHGEILCRR